MTEQFQHDQEDRRAFARHASTATALIVRDSDRMRSGIRGQLSDISIAGFAVLLSAPLEVGESISVELENPIQRAKVSLRACVRYVLSEDERTYRVGCSVLNRLTVQQVEALRSSRI